MPTPRSRTLFAVSRWGTADATDPRVLQLILAALLLMGWAVQFPGRRSAPSLVVLACAALAVTAISMILPWSRWSPERQQIGFEALSVADIVVIGAFYAMAPDSAGVVLLGLPALWLGRSGPRGVALCVVAVGAGVVAPVLGHDGVTPASLLRGLLPALVAVLVTVAKAAALERDRYEQRVTSALVETVGVGLQLVRADGSTIRSNGHVPQLELGAHGPDGFPVRSAIERAAAGEPLDGVLVHTDTTDASVYSLSARPVHDKKGVLVAAALAWHDVTPLVKALEADESLLASVSHDLRTPLTAVMGYLELLEAEPLSEQGRTMLATITTNSERLLFLIGDLVTAAEERRKGITLSRSLVDVSDLVTRALSTAVPEATRSQVSLSASMSGPAYHEIDAKRLTQVLENLLSNAIKYNNPGGSVTVTVCEEASELVIEVADDGIGIPEDARAHVFDRHFRVDAVRDTRPGTGLGLDISRRIVELHGGRIDLRSELGEGSTFTIRLPSGPSPAIRGREVDSSQPWGPPIAATRSATGTAGRGETALEPSCERPSSSGRPQ